MYQKSLIYRTFICMVVLPIVSCTYSGKNSIESNDSDTVELHDKVLWTTEELNKDKEYSERADELFDDFLYNYVHDVDLQKQRTVYPLKETLLTGKVVERTQRESCEDFSFMDGEYTTIIYNNEQEKSFNEDTALLQASLEKIDLVSRKITSYDFLRDCGKWNLVAIRNISFSNSDLCDFLSFYSKFSQDLKFQHKSIASSIHISMMDPDDYTQTIEGFITKEQCSAIISAIPSGVITNIRYGQQYKHTRRILIEKNSMGNGMSETFCFAKNGNRWGLVGYEN